MGIRDKKATPETPSCVGFPPRAFWWGFPYMVGFPLWVCSMGFPYIAGLTSWVFLMVKNE